MSKLDNRYWLEIENEHFFNDNDSNVPPQTPYHECKHQTRLSRFEAFPESRMCFNKPTPLYITQNPDLFLTYKGEFSLQTGKRYPLQLPEGKQCDKLSTQLISGKVIHGKKVYFLL